MLTIADDTFADLATFSLRWRWTSERHAMLPPEELERVRPLRDEAVASLMRRVWEECRVVDDGACDSATFAIAERVRTDRGDVRRWLADRLPPDRTPLLVCWWCKPLAVLTDSDIFIRHWDTFCYPSSDDVMILPLDVVWALRYDHEEEFVFAQRRSLANPT